MGLLRIEDFPTLRALAGHDPTDSGFGEEKTVPAGSRKRERYTSPCHQADSLLPVTYTCSILARLFPEEMASRALPV